MKKLKNNFKKVKKFIKGFFSKSSIENIKFFIINKLIKYYLKYFKGSFVEKIVKKLTNNFKKKSLKESIKKFMEITMKTGVTGIKRIMNAFKYSFEGLKAVYKSEEAFRQDLLVCLILFPIIVFLTVSFIEKILLLSTLFAIVFAELINTAIEFIIDRISEEIHPLSKIAKDIGSSIVFISFLYMFMVWSIILYANFV